MLVNKITVKTMLKTFLQALLTRAALKLVFFLLIRLLGFLSADSYINGNFGIAKGFVNFVNVIVNDSNGGFVKGFKRCCFKGRKK